MNVRLEYERWMKQAGGLALCSVKEFFEPEQYQKQWDRLGDAITTNQYTWGAEKWKHVFDTVPGRQKLFELMLKTADSKIDPAVIAGLHIGGRLRIYSVLQLNSLALVRTRSQWAEDTGPIDVKKGADGRSNIPVSSGSAVSTRSRSYTATHNRSIYIGTSLIVLMAALHNGLKTDAMKLKNTNRPIA